jgi:hypothetical protein
MKSDGTLLMGRGDVAELLPLGECIKVVEEIFRLQGEGKIPVSQILSVKAAAGGLHVKAGLLPGHKNYIVGKLNTTSRTTQPDLVFPLFKG